MSIRNVLNNLDLVISKKGQILRRPDIGSIIVKDTGVSHLVNEIKKHICYIVVYAFCQKMLDFGFIFC